MSTETFFSQGEYKKNYDRIKNEFINAYIDNDEEEFIALQTEWYQRCLKNTILEVGIVADCIGLDTIAMISGEDFVKVVDNKVRNERGEVCRQVAQNLNVSFKKIIKFLQHQKEGGQPLNKLRTTATQFALFHFTLQKCEIKPRFQEKVKEIEALTKEYGTGAKNFQIRYNEINNSGGLEGYSMKDVVAVKKLLIEKYPKAVSYFDKLTIHIF